MAKLFSLVCVGTLAFTLTSCGSSGPSAQEQAMEIVRVACIEGEVARQNVSQATGWHAPYWAIMHPALTKAAKLDSSYVPVLEASLRTSDIGQLAKDDLVKIEAACAIARS